MGMAYADANSVPLAISVDRRGLLLVPGVLRGNSEHNWGAHNLIVKPYGGWAAQDYCLKNIKKTGQTLSADFSAKPPLKMVQTFAVQKDKPGRPMRVHYTLTPADGGEVSYECVYLVFPFATKDFAGGKAVLDDGTEIPLPETPGKADIELPRKTRSITLANAKHSFTIRSDDLVISLHDLRPKTSAFNVRLDYPKPQHKKSIELDFEASAAMIPYRVVPDGKTWVKLPHRHGIEPGGILDFSVLNDAPAGKYGRIISKDGHFAYEQTGRRVRLIGTNLCYTANYLKKPEADRIAAHFQKMGYNAVRFHHTDVHLRKGNWGSTVSDDIDPEYLDRLDYLFAAMKKAGLYVTIDLYSQRRFGKGEILGVDRVVEGDIKGLLPIHEPAFEAWKKLVVKWMNHVNPYTGLAWKDDPALVFVCPLNEDTVASAWGGVARPFYLARFAEWKKQNGLTSTVGDPARDPLFARFLIEVKMASNRKVAAFLRDLGVKAMLSGSNWWDTKAQAFTRDQFDVVDNHQYADHPQPWSLPAKYNQQSTLRSHPTYMTPIFMASTRQFGKPFTVTEYNFCAPNRYRAEGGALMGAYASLQDWDGLYRFAWAHNAKRVNDSLSLFGFDLSSDPLNQLTERQIVLLFGRGDIAPAKKRFVYGVTMDDATRQGVGGMWAKGLFPHAFNAMALVSQTGSQVIEGGRPINGTFDAVVTDGVPVDEATLNGNAYRANAALPKVGKEVVSDTGEIRLDRTNGSIRIRTPKTNCIVAPKGVDAEAGSLAIRNNTAFCSVSASAMDGRDLADSRRVLLLHLTDVLNTGMQFRTEKMLTLVAYGSLPHIVRAGSVDITLKNSQPGLRLYACDSTGRRIHQVETTYADGAYRFQAVIAKATPTMVYELTAGE